jgi:hypothetical protein
MAFPAVRFCRWPTLPRRQASAFLLTYHTKMGAARFAGLSKGARE